VTKPLRNRVYWSTR